ncbi:RHS repeat domain-containing protein [Robinsoniella sp. KNHs210]|uniref:RHS repeat domain-containing protein n=1 Tax=Robinsoniella sp. KNHs210 TaxID=1469950 RepID=UPI0004834FF6|nr:RHS repeat-associated core domain-containing protein [Robinsoniella sp. KNHs210]
MARGNSQKKKTAEKQADRQSNNSKSDRSPYRYAGEYRDEETGYIYLRARYYDAKLGRFLNADPAKQGRTGMPMLVEKPGQSAPDQVRIRQLLPIAKKPAAGMGPFQPQWMEQLQVSNQER